MSCFLYVSVFALTALPYGMMDVPIACPKNERYVRCVYEVCHKTCEDMRYPPPSCPLMSLTCEDPGCVCDVGYLRNNQGVCVNIGDCELPVDRYNDPDAFECPTNEKYFRCSSESCYKTCQHIMMPPPCLAAPLGCYEPACLCDIGYLRNDVGVCVPIYECPL